MRSRAVLVVVAIGLVTPACGGGNSGSSLDGLRDTLRDGFVEQIDVPADDAACLAGELADQGTDLLALGERALDGDELPDADRERYEAALDEAADECGVDLP